MKKIYNKLFFVLLAVVIGFSTNVYADCAESSKPSAVFDEGSKKFTITAPSGYSYYLNGTSTTVSNGSVVAGKKNKEEDSILYILKLSTSLKPQSWYTNCEAKCKEGSTEECPADCGNDDTLLNTDKCNDGTSGTWMFTGYVLPETPETSGDTYSSTLTPEDRHPQYPDRRIDCNKFTDDNDTSFEGRFCRAKRRSGKAYTFPTDTMEKQDLYCKYDKYYKESELQKEDYYRSKDFLYGKREYKEYAKYTYHVSSSKTIKETYSCTVLCEEAVDVEYGPPVASKAGLCFEYKIRVTSRVSCSVTEALKPPKEKYKVCHPKPSCSGTNSKTGKSYSGLDKGGPNEDFYACMSNCENGSYSNKCTKKCYKAVYGYTPKVGSDMLAYEISKLGHSDCGGGRYTGYIGSISWSGGGAARYYSCHCPSNYIPDGSGICRHNYGGGNVCQDSCHWTNGNCKQGDYLNYADVPGDIGSRSGGGNDGEYMRVKKLCEDYVKCSTSQATFTIDVSYVDGSNKKQTIHYPYDNNDKGTIDYTTTRRYPGGANNTFGNKNTTLLNGNGDNPTYDKIEGCYTEKGREDFYRVPWSLTDSFINYKTGEISYSFDKKGDIWQPVKKKFCVPADAQDVNQKWWNNYFHATGGDQYTRVTDEVCKYTEVETGLTTLNEGDITYNIHAETRQFGYFGWDIDINCFYALNKVYPKVDVSKVPSQCSTDPSTGVRVRSIDLENVFPSTSGEVKGGATETGRTPGFNWSEGAVNSKNPDYKANPTSLIEKIQLKGYSVYSNDNLDYYFELSKEDLVTMKKKASLDDNNYTAFEEKNFVKPSKSYGLSRYISTKIRELKGKYPKSNSKALNCNNMVRFDSEECED